MRKTRKVPFTFTMDPDIAERLFNFAESERRSIAFMICEAVAFYLESKGK